MALKPSVASHADTCLSPFDQPRPRDAAVAKVSRFQFAERMAMNGHGRPVSVAPNVMLITRMLEQTPVGGRALLNRLIHDALVDVFGPQLVTIEIPSRRVHGFRSILGAFTGYIDGLDETFIADAVRTIREKQVGKVLIDGSNLGKVVGAIKRSCPDVEVSTFFHNCEARFFLGAFRQFRTIRSLGVLIANYLAERRAVRYSDKLICLSDRDSNLLRKLYGRGATHVSAMALQDRLPLPLPPENCSASERYALFVGGSFYANQAGIAWFAEHVAPRIPIKTYVVGRGFESLKHALERHGNIEVVGAVDSLAPWYRGAQFVVAPIFDGSGMKTKVAEALMFGKRVIGTPEAFSGYEDVARRAGVICESSDDFVHAIGSETDREQVELDPELRSIYEERYSFAAARSRLAKILGALE